MTKVVMDVLGSGAGEGVGGSGAGSVGVAVNNGARVWGGGELYWLAGRACVLDAVC